MLIFLILYFFTIIEPYRYKTSENTSKIRPVISSVSQTLGFCKSAIWSIGLQRDRDCCKNGLAGRSGDIHLNLRAVCMHMYAYGVYMNVIVLTLTTSLAMVSPPMLKYVIFKLQRVLLNI